MIDEMRNKLKNLIDWAYYQSSTISGGLGAVFSIIGISNIHKWNIGECNFPIGEFIYWGVVMLFFIFFITSLFYKKEMSELEKKINSINDLETKLVEEVNSSNELFNSYLRLLVKSLNFTYNDRISVYKVNENKFQLIGRTSINPILMEKGRNEYPIEEGFIGKGWQEEEFFINNLPCPETNFKQYYKKINDISPIPKEVVESMTMKSRNYFVYRMNNNNEIPQAIFVFESKLPNGLKKDLIKEKLVGVKETLVMFIQRNNGLKVTKKNHQIEKDMEI
ncbi:hypothetical protein HMPREF9078_00678 [Capnocytophaga sp. oral taxon 380 str. F0488]|nr:hypothetical protein HMPREF9078_00678 [Capnocytophaga sp. oral taxon 380 str. F0488]